MTTNHDAHIDPRPGRCFMLLEPVEPAAMMATTIQLDSCHVCERFLIRTRNSRYEIIVLSGRFGDVLVRGGQRWPEFVRARVVGAKGASSAVKVRAMCVGLHLELRIDGTSFVTSRIEGITRDDRSSMER